VTDDGSAVPNPGSSRHVSACGLRSRLAQLPGRSGSENARTLGVVVVEDALDGSARFELVRLCAQVVHVAASFVAGVRSTAPSEERRATEF